MRERERDHTDDETTTSGDTASGASRNTNHTDTEDSPERVTADEASPAPMHKRHAETASETEEDTPRDVQEHTVCPECGSSEIRQSPVAETVCQDCGLVLDETQIDYGPEWRAYTATERQERSRTGSPLTALRHDKGLSTTIDWKNKDASGNTISNAKQRQMHRLRKWDERAKRDSGEDNIAYANGEIKRMGAALGVPRKIQETAASLYRQAYQNDLIIGRSIEGMASAAFYIALRVHNNPRSFDEISTVARIDRKSIQRCYQYTCRELSIGLEPTDPGQYVPRYGNGLDVPQEFVTTAKQLITELNDTHHVSGNDPTVLAASALYAASILHGQLLTQSAVQSVSNVTEVSIRNNYKMFLKYTDLSPFHPDDLTAGMTPTDIAEQLYDSPVYYSDTTDQDTDSAAIRPAQEIEALELPERNKPVRLEHDTPGRFLCVCNTETFNTQSEFLKHVRHTHDPSSSVATPVVHSAPTDATNSTTETIDYGNEDYHFSCPVCPVITATYSESLLHIQLAHYYTGLLPTREKLAVPADTYAPTAPDGTITTQTPLTCSACETAFTSYLSYRLHVARCYDLPVCELPALNTLGVAPTPDATRPVQVSTLFEPTITEPDVYPDTVFNFRCPDCYTVFNTYKGLRIHIGHSHTTHLEQYRGGYAVSPDAYPVTQ